MPSPPRVLRTTLAAALLSLSSSSSSPLPWGGTVQLDAWGRGIRVRLAPPSGSVVDPEVQALLPGRASSSSPTTMTVDDLRADVDPATGLVTFTRVSDGSVLLAQTGVRFGKAATYSRPGSVSTLVSFSGLVPGERVYGLGEHPSAPSLGMTEFNSSWALENNGVLTIPWYVSSRGYGVLNNVPAYGNVSVGAKSVLWGSVATLNADFWVAASDPAAPLPLADVLSRYVDAVGHAPAMPYASTGFWQSKNRYRNQTQLIEVAQGFKQRGLPLSVLVIDYLHWRTLGDDSFNPVCWPDPAGMSSELRDLGVEEVLVSVYPYQNEGSAHYAEFVPALSAVDLTGATNAYNGCLSGMTLYDPFNATARAAKFQAWVDGYGKYNLSWVWQDCSEPGRDDAHNGRWKFASGTDSEVGPAWVRAHAQMFSEGKQQQAAAQSASSSPSFVTLSRSAYPGIWAQGAALWSGDIEPTFASMAQQVLVMQSALMSGVAWWASDTGGYLGGNTTDPEWQELIVRWAWWSALTPIMRFHGKRVDGPPVDPVCGPTNGPNEPWAFGDAAFAAITPALLFRESIRAYVYNVSLATSATGLPMARPLALAFPNDPACAAGAPFTEVAYLFGPKYLVQPVTTYGARTATVYLPVLPAGSSWVSYFNASLVVPGGGVNVTVPAPLDEIPLFVLVAGGDSGR
jgi:alpha-D-xyloside xylohydrolase